MISITTLLTIVNTLLLTIFGVIYLKKNYVVMTTKEYETIAQFVEEHTEETETSLPTPEELGIGDLTDNTSEE